MLASLLPWLADALIVLGLVLLSIAVYGMIWLPDLYTRLHAASKAAVVAVLPLLMAAALSGEPAMLCRLILIAAFLLLTTPVATHAIGRAAFIAGEAMQTPGALNESQRPLRQEHEEQAEGRG